MQICVSLHRQGFLCFSFDSLSSVSLFCPILICLVLLYFILFYFSLDACLSSKEKQGVDLGKKEDPQGAEGQKP